jgi:uncharacterized protein (DUF302 family)
MRPRLGTFVAASLLALGLSACASPNATAPERGGMLAENGIVLLRSAYGIDETVRRLKQDVADKGIMFFQDIDQARLAADAGIELRPSRLLIFGNPPLGSQFMTSNPTAGIDWPVRLLVFEAGNGQVWAEYNDFDYIARRHGITDRDPQFKMASEVIASITASVAQR